MAIGFHLVVRLNGSTNLPEDDVINTFTFTELPPGTTNADVKTMCSELYNGIGPALQPISWWLSKAITHGTNAASAEVFDLSLPQPRVPILATPFDIGNSGGSGPLPLEVALCLSFKGIMSSGDVAARHRGRVYIGPLVTEACDNTIDEMPVPDAALVETLLDRATFLNTFTNGAWGIWSRADDSVYEVTSAWVDNEFDTQRRRGRRATSRGVVAFP